MGDGIGFQYPGRTRYYSQDSKGYNKSYGKKSKYYYDYNDWDWGNFGSNWRYSWEEDSDKDLVIKAHDGYMTPKSSDFDWKIEYDQRSQDNKNFIREMSRFFYYRMMNEKEYFIDEWKDPASIKEADLEKYAIKKDLYENLWDKFVPGYSPLEKALAVFKQIAEKNKGTDPSRQPADLDVNTPSMITFHEEIYADSVYNELLDANAYGNKFRLDIMNRISLIRDLGSQFKVEKEIEEKLVSNSRIIAKKMMRDYSQMHNIDLYQRLMPTFNARMLTKDLTVNVPVDRTEHKQKIIMLLDFSGSMCREDKQKWVVAIMIDRLRYAIKEEAEIFFSYFLDDPDKLRFTHVYDRETALSFWSKFSTYPNGGETSLGSMVSAVDKEIRQGGLFNLDIDLSDEKPEILAINDGQDSVKTDNFDYKTNAISVIDGPNEQLKSLCLKNKGKYVHVGDQGARTWSEEGERLLTI